MVGIIVVSFIIFFLAILMTMTGRGGGNFYVLVLILSGVPMHNAATTGQFILASTAISASIIFKKGKTLSVPLAFFIGSITAASAFAGGLTSNIFSGRELKYIFSIILALAGVIMLFTVERKNRDRVDRPGYWNLRSEDGYYVINLWVAIPFAAAVGFFSGMVGVSGGSFLVPLMLLFCGVPMKIAVGTSSAMVAATAAAGFTGHVISGGFNPVQAVPFAIAAVAGGTIGGKTALRSKPAHLKTLFAVTTLVAALLMLINAYSTG